MRKYCKHIKLCNIAHEQLPHFKIIVVLILRYHGRIHTTYSTRGTILKISKIIEFIKNNGTHHNIASILNYIENGVKKQIFDDKNIAPIKIDSYLSILLTELGLVTQTNEIIVQQTATNITAHAPEIQKKTRCRRAYRNYESSPKGTT